MFMAMVVYKLPADRYEQEFAKDWDLWEDVLRTLVVRFLANSSAVVHPPVLTRELVMLPFLTAASPEPPETNLEAHRSHQARRLFYHAFCALVQFAVRRYMETRDVEIDPAVIPQSLLVPFEKAFIHHNTWTMLNKLDEVNMRIFFNMLFELYLPAVLDMLRARQEDVHGFRSLCTDVLVVLAESKLSNESIRILYSQHAHQRDFIL
jgi:hypothetical protein